jgi:hypothetical protein
MDSSGARTVYMTRRLPRLGIATDLLAAGLTSGLLALGVAVLIRGTETVDLEPPATCAAFQVGSPYPATTHLHLESLAGAATEVHLELVDESGISSLGERFVRVVPPGASENMAIRTPALGTVLKLVYAGTGLQLSARIVRDDDAPIEPRKAIPCLADAGPRGGEALRR